MHELRRTTQRSRHAVALSIVTLGLTILIAANASADAESTCTHYASTNGGGDGLSQFSPFQIADFWSVAGPGTTLCLLDGTYRGPANMIIPPAGKSGTSSAPITIRALNDGRVFIDGQFARVPLVIEGQSYWTFQGFDAGNSTGDVISINNSGVSSTGLTFQRVCASNTNGVNNMVWGVHYT